MFNSVNFGNTKFNSRLIRQAVIPPIEPSDGDIRLRERKKKLFKREFFDIIGTKLIFDKQIFDIIGIARLPRQLGINLRGQTLEKVQQDLLLKGQISYPFKTRQEILGLVKFAKENHLGITGRSVTDLIRIKQLHLIYGQKLFSSIQSKAIKGSKSIQTKQINLIRGKKDISEILEILELLDIEE